MDLKGLSAMKTCIFRGQVSLETECPQEFIANKDEQSGNEQETSEDEAEFNENMELIIVKE